jgi:hypothetical protein
VEEEMTALTQEILEHLQRLDENKQEQVLEFIQVLEMSEVEGTWTPEELAELMESVIHPKPKTGAEIVALLEELKPTGWEDVGDGATWVAKMRGYKDIATEE